MPFDIRLLAFPEIEVSGVRRSCEIARRRFARSCSFFARIAASSFSLAFFFRMWYSHFIEHCILYVFQRQSTFAEYGQQNTFFKRIKRLIAYINTYNAVNSAVNSYGEV